MPVHARKVITDSVSAALLAVPSAPAVHASREVAVAQTKLPAACVEFGLEDSTPRSKAEPAAGGRLYERTLTVLVSLIAVDPQAVEELAADAEIAIAALATPALEVVLSSTRPLVNEGAVMIHTRQLSYQFSYATRELTPFQLEA